MRVLAAFPHLLDPGHLVFEFGVHNVFFFFSAKIGERRP